MNEEAFEKAASKDRKPKPFLKIRGYFLAGLVVTAPIFITLYLTWLFFSFVDNNVAKILPDTVYYNFYTPGLGFFIALLFFIAVGWFATNFLGKTIISLSDYLLDKMPVIRTIYGAIKQIIETVMATQSDAFREVVMLEYPRKNVWSIGFVTGTSKGEVQRRVADDTVNVFLPTTPNPTSGFLLFVPRSELIFMDMTVEEGVKLVVSAGIVSPPDRKAAKSPAVKETIKKNTAKKPSSQTSTRSKRKTK